MARVLVVVDLGDHNRRGFHSSSLVFLCRLHHPHLSQTPDAVLQISDAPQRRVNRLQSAPTLPGIYFRRTGINEAQLAPLGVTHLHQVATGAVAQAELLTAGGGDAVQRVAGTGGHSGNAAEAQHAAIRPTPVVAALACIGGRHLNAHLPIRRLAGGAQRCLIARAALEVNATAVGLDDLNLAAVVHQHRLVADAPLGTQQAGVGGQAVVVALQLQAQHTGQGRQVGFDLVLVAADQVDGVACADLQANIDGYFILIRCIYYRYYL
jgi:hypothetical protein